MVQRRDVVGRILSSLAALQPNKIEPDNKKMASSFLFRFCHAVFYYTVLWEIACSNKTRIYMVWAISPAHPGRNGHRKLTHSLSTTPTTTTSTRRGRKKGGERRRLTISSITFCAKLSTSICARSPPHPEGNKYKSIEMPECRARVLSFSQQSEK